MRARRLPISLAAVAALAASGPPETRAQDVPVDSVRLLADLSVLAHDSMQGRAPGTPGSLRARAFLARALQASGAEAIGDDFLHPFEGGPRAGPGVNVVGVVRGTDPAPRVIVLTAHYDHLGMRGDETFNGADDNASGTAAALEIARALATSPLRHTVVIALVDMEELGMRGSRAFVDSGTVPRNRMALNVNLDMVARTGGVLWAAGAFHEPEIGRVLDRVAAAAPLRLLQGHDRPDAAQDDWTPASDHIAFHEVGIPFVYFGVEDHVDYHRSTDDFERVDPAEYVAAVRTLWLALRALDEALPFGTPEAR